MSDWINKKADEYRQTKDDREYRENTVSVANYWVNLIEQLKQDIALMNAVPDWQEQLTPPIKLDIEHEVYVIKKLHYPLVMVAMLNKGTEMALDIVKQDTAYTERKSHKETWKVVPDGRYTCLQRGRDKFIIPEQATEQLLKPIVDSILASLEQK